MTLTSAQWADALDPIVRYWFMLADSRPPSLVPTLYNVQGSMRASEQAAGIGAIGVEAWDSYEAGNGVGSADLDETYKTTFTHKEFPLDVPIERKLIADNNLGLMQRNVELMGESAALKREIDGASVFNHAFSDTYAGADAVGLCSTAHPVSPNKTGTTISNKFTLALNLPNLRTIREAMMAFEDDKGNPIGVVPDTILVPIGLQDDAIPIAGSPLDPTSANNAVNPQSGRRNVIMWHYLTDSNAWFVIDSRKMKRALFWFNREPLTINPKVEDKTLVLTWRAYMRYSYGFSDFRWIAGSNPS